MKFNKKYFIIFISLLLTEVVIALFVRDNFIRPYFGDVLVVMLIYSFFCSFLKKPPKLLPFYVFIFAVLVEVGQYYNLVKILHLENNTFARVIIGTSFSFNDILCYFAGMIISFLF